MSRSSLFPEVGMGYGRDGLAGGGGGDDMGLLLREQWRMRELGDRERELNLCRSGSAPPTVNESRTAAAGGLSGGRSATDGPPEREPDPPYLAFFNALVNADPYVPQRSLAGSSAMGGAMDIRGLAECGSGESLFSVQPGFSEQREGSEVQPRKTPDLLDQERDVLIGYRDSANGERSLTDIFQDDLGRGTPLLGFSSCVAGWNGFGDFTEPLDAPNNQLALPQGITSVDGFGTGRNLQSAVRFQHNGVLASGNPASIPASSVTRTAAPDYHLTERVPSPRLPSSGVRFGAADTGMNYGCWSFNGISPRTAQSDELVDALTGLRLSKEDVLDMESAYLKYRQQCNGHQDLCLQFPESQKTENHIQEHPFWRNSEHGRLGASCVPQSMMSLHPHFVKGVSSKVDLSKFCFSSPKSFSKAHSASSIPSSGNLSHYFDNGSAIASSPGMDSRSTRLGFSVGTRAADLQTLSRMGSPAAAGALQMPLSDQYYMQYLMAAEFANQGSRASPAMGAPHAELLDNTYTEPVLPPQRLYGMPFLGNPMRAHHDYHANPPFDLRVQYPGSPSANSNLPLSPAGPGSPIGLGERNLHFPCSSLPQSPAGPSSPFGYGERSMRFPSCLRINGGVTGSWHSDSAGIADDEFPPSLLEEFKANKTISPELSEIAGHVVEFSSDQYGSRFIQQKLETATIGEKNMVFKEIMPQALSLMTDVFGNYVIQKFFDHGTATQIRELANQVYGNVLALSLQMYGCRVIQKAIEVVDLDQRTKMAAELDGHVMLCIRDQNGNHVIQKCIECIPQDAIKFIISSFLDQVVSLSTHPYGCRVIQRVLEHCDDPKTQQIVMDEIMQCVCMLAQDQYGNYVIQHVLEHGKPHERSAIIQQLAGQIVQMSQQKFASNVVEKCLIFGGPKERQILVNEMLGLTDENEPLQAMMKDQFGNYVVQKVLETVDDQQRELILTRIKIHLNTLKKYTYGKHIVVRVEKLVAAGECMTSFQDRVVSDLTKLIDN